MLQTAGHSTGLFKPANNGSMLGYIPSGVDVRVGFVSAGITVEISTTSSANTLALVARLGRVSRVNGHHWHTREGGLIANELFQLVESPRMKPAALFFAARRLPNTGKVFQHNGLPVFFCFLYDVLADLVVSVSLVASLFAAKRAQETAAVTPRRRARPFCCLRSGATGAPGNASRGRHSASLRRSSCRPTEWQCCLRRGPLPACRTTHVRRGA